MSIDYEKEAEKIEKNYQDLLKIRKTSVLEDIRLIVERIEEHKKVQEEAIEEKEKQCNRLQLQHSEIEEMKKQMPTFRKKIQMAEKVLSENDKLLSILLKHPKFYINSERKYAYNVVVEGSIKLTFFVSLLQNSIEYKPKIGFPTDFPANLLEPAELSFEEFQDYCNEIENLIIN